MVIDAGGGTIDITAHVEVDGGVVVQNIPSGNAWGGTQVNEEFSKLLQEIVSDPGFEKFLALKDRTKNQATLNKIVYTEFEKQKVLLGQGKTEEIAVELPKNFVRLYKKALIEGVEKVSGTDYDSNENDTLRIDKSVTESKLFGPAIQGIIDCTLSAIEKINYNPNTFYLVGAFGGCKYVHEKVSAAIKRYYQSKGHKDTCAVLVPPTPQLAVATGAAMWRKNPEKFKARQVDATYGIGVGMKFDGKKHKEAFKIYNKDKKEYRCTDVFKVFLEKGELAKGNEVATATITPEWKDTKQMNIGIYATPYSRIQYIKDEDNELIVTLIGELVIDVLNPDNLPLDKKSVPVYFWRQFWSTRRNLPLDKREIDITMEFSGTEIHARAYYRVTGEEVKTVCDYI